MSEDSVASGDVPLSSPSEPQLLVKRHIRYCKRTVSVLPSSAQPLDTSRMTILYFGLSGLDVLNALDSISAKEKQEMIEWIYAMQLLPDKDNPASNMHLCGFRGATFVGAPFDLHKAPIAYPYDCSHITMTYTALASLLILGDDLSHVNRPAVFRGMREIQLDSGSFCFTAQGSEDDMRFMYSASCVCYILNDWSGMDVDKAVNFIKRSQGFDGGIGQGPFQESHGGSTFCALASLVLMGKLHEAFTPTELERLKRWCLRRQHTGFQGRPNKPVDTCYSFWVGASLELLGGFSLVDKMWNRSYVLSTQGEYTGGFSKWPDSDPDPMHTYLGLCGLSLNGEPGLRPLYPALNLSQRAADWLHELQNRR